MNEAQTGYLLIDKPAGWTSFDVVAKLRSITGIRKIGHAGTLDPFATGLLIVAVGRGATKNIDTIVKKRKTYDTVFELGATSDTHDPEGSIEYRSCSMPSEKDVAQAIKTFADVLEQIPPMHSAVKVDGKRLYKLAREGKTIERKPRRVEIHRFDITSYEPPTLSALIECSSGTYIRAIARDLGEKLGCGAYCKELRRTAIGDVSINDAVSIQDLDKKSWVEHLQEATPPLAPPS